jgi:hypothetical protein
MMDEKYYSKYSNGKTVSAAQYITEIICERKATKDKLDLHYRFWLQKSWAMFYRNQIASANKLVKQYPPQAIIKALNSDVGRKIYSLRAPHLVGMIEQQVKIIAANQSKNASISKKMDIKESKDVVFQNNIGKKNILSKLKELDNES